MKNLLTSDWHFTDSIYDEYKWDLFPYLKNVCSAHKIDNIFMLGDITEKKDNHSAKLVNKLLTSIQDLAKQVNIVFLQGNHDAIDKNIPFFKFLQSMEHVEFINKPTIKYYGSGNDYLFLPYSEDINEIIAYINGCNEIAPDKVKTVFMHQTVLGSISQNGHILEKGLNPTVLPNFIQVYAGDIHKPQIINNIEYVGSPYHNYFGDKYIGQIILLENNVKFKYLNPNLPSKLVIDTELNVLPKENLFSGDQVKFRVYVRKEDYHLFDSFKQDIKNFCTNLALNLKSIESVPIITNTKVIGALPTTLNESKEETLERFKVKESLNDEYLQIGKELIL